MSKSRGVAATSDGIAKIKARMAELEKPIDPGKTGKNCWTQEYLAKQANVSLDTVKRCLKGIAIDESCMIPIVKALNLELADIIDEIQQSDPEPPPQPDDINWHQICESRLDAYKQRFLTNPLTAGNPLDFYVPLGLVEPKREQEKRQKDEVNPEEGSRFYQETEVTKTYTEPNQFFEEVLRQGNSKTKGQRLAIIGEPGAGKTTLLYQISRWILQENLGYPILIRLAEVNQPLRQFLTRNWLRDAEGSPTEVSPEWVSAFEKLITGGKVWLLLDAVDEMGITSPLATINQQLTEGWMQGLRVLLTCRLNVWETEKNALRDFDVYRNLDFNSQQIQDFIEQYFSDATQSQELLKQLKEPNQNRVNDLIKNPLRLALLCRTWKRGQKLPETQAGLYQRLVNSHYQWKDEQKPFQIPLDVQECLHEKLGELAKDAINREQFRFRLEEKFLEKYLGKPQRENTLFYWALKLGWLNRVGLASVEERDSDQAVYAFFHPTFQEYFAALAIQDWDYFLPQNHVNCPVEGKEYRIFQPQWKQVILLWLGRDDVDEGEKEAFIQKLVDFETGCHNFYWYRACFLAAAGINEFKECSLSDAIVEQIVKWGFGYFNIEKQEWRTFFDPIKEGAKTVLPETIRKSAIDNLIEVLETTENEDTRREVAKSLEKIAVGNELAIRALIRVLETTENEDTRREVAESLGEIAIGNELAIRELIRLLQTTQDKSTRSLVAKSLGEIAVGNELAIGALIRVLETTEDEVTGWVFALSLGKIAVGNELAIGVLIRLLETTQDEDTRSVFALSLGEIAVGNELAIGELIRVLETTQDEDTRRSVACSLGKIAPANELAIRALIRVLETTQNEDTRRSVACSLGKIAPGNELAIGALIRVLEITENEDTHKSVAESLGKIAPGNELAIGELIRLLQTTQNELTRRTVVESLGEIAPGNELVIWALIRLLETTQDESTRWRVAESLGEIDPGNELEIRELIRVLETTQNEDTRWRVAESLGEIAPGNELAIGALIRVLETTQNEYTRRWVAESLGEIAVVNELAIRELIRVLETTQNEYTRWRVAESLGKIDPGNELAIRELIRVLETTQNEYTRWRVAESLGKIAVVNELAIRELIRVLETTQNEDTRQWVAESLGKIAVVNELAIRELIRVLETTQNEDTRRWVAESLGEIIKTEKQYTDFVFALNHNLTDEVYNNNFDLYEECFKLLWKCAENLPYPKFYQAWHHNTLTPHPEIIDNTPVGNTPTVRQLEQQFTDICSQLPYPHLHCIDAKKLQNLNSESKFVQAFCNRLYQKLLPNETIPEVQTLTNLETKIINLKKQLQTPHLFILLQGDATPNPEVIECCDYLTDVLNLAWVTPESLPGSSSQRFFVSSQENLLDAVRSWVEENQISRG
jgi:HEAT repeat protein/DNA polymerase III delta prime subunit